MRFGKRLPNDTATLLHARDLHHRSARALRPGRRRPGRARRGDLGHGAVLLLGVYAVWVWSYLRTGQREHPAREAAATGISTGLAVGLIFGAGLAATFVSEWLVHAIEPGRRRARHLARLHRARHRRDRRQCGRERRAITSAWKGNHDLALSVVNNAVSQTAVVVFPLLVLRLVLLRRAADLRARADLHRGARR